MVEKIVSIMKNKTMKECLKINIVDELPSITDSKFGGIPYLPDEFEYPVVLDGENAGKPLSLLAQINFEQLPVIEDLPDKGILQFYILSNELYGLDFKDQIKQNEFRVIYHENIEPNINIDRIKKIDSTIDKSRLPLQNEAKINLTKGKSYINNTLYAFKECYEEVYDSLEETESIKDEIKNIQRQVIKEISEYGSRIFGYPAFMQDDLRENKLAYSYFDTLLLQIDSDSKNNIMWGDMGIANFFIKSEDLKNKNFNEILYNWDCC